MIGSAPHFVQNEFLGQDLAGMADQEAQQVIFARRQLHLRTRHRHDPAHQIHGQIAALEQRLLALLLQAVAQRGLETAPGERPVRRVRTGELDRIDTFDCCLAQRINVKAACRKTARAVWAADGGQRASAPPPTRQAAELVPKD